jgi:uncharacterized protein YkuJ
MPGTQDVAKLNFFYVGVTEKQGVKIQRKFKKNIEVFVKVAFLKKKRFFEKKTKQ